MSNVKISVIIPAHNEEAVIEKAVQSILKQTYSNFEIIIVNDGSTDKTREIVEKLMKKNKKIRMLNFDKGHSAAFARNNGAKIATGKFLVFLDADTEVIGNFLRVVSEKSEGVDAVAVPCYPRNVSLISLALSGMISKRYNRIAPEKKYSLGDLGKPLFFSVSKKAFDKINGYDESVFYFEDELFVERFYNSGFSCFFTKESKQFYELPATFSEFVRQCKWIAKGLSTLKDVKKRKKVKMNWFVKLLFMILPILFIFNPIYFLVALSITVLPVWAGLTFKNRNPLLSILTLPFVYIKTILVNFFILTRN